MIWCPRHLTRSQREERRLAAGRLLQAGQLSHADIARRLGVSRMAVSKWAQQLRQHQGDMASLHAWLIPGRPAHLNAEQWQRVLAVLQEGALKAGFETDRWTLLRICAVVLVTFGVRYHAHYLARRLRALGWSPQQPAVYARERDDALVRAWLMHDWPQIKKKARRHQAEIMFVDETGFSFRAKTGTTWASKGQTPVLRRVSQRRELSTVIGLTLSGRIDKRHFAHAICGEDVVIILRHFQRHVPGPLVIIWDRLNAHRAKVVKAHVEAHPEIEVHWLPPYAPDLNPEEGAMAMSSSTCAMRCPPASAISAPGLIAALRASANVRISSSDSSGMPDLM
jgi:transposase